MIKFGIVGSDNSHAEAFSQLCNLEKGFGGLKVEDAKVVAIYGQEPKRTEEVARNGQIPSIIEKVEHMIGLVDAVLVVFRHGGLHASHALPFIEAGIPTFVDKPFAVAPKDAEQMLGAARKRNTLLTSFSTLRFAKSTRELLEKLKSAGPLLTGSITGPVSLTNEYGGLHFYGCHVTELMAGIFGYGVREVRAIDHKNNVHATVLFQDDRIVNLQFLGNARSIFYATALGKDGSGQCEVDTSGCYKDGLEVVLEMIRSKKRPLTDEQLLETVRVTDAVVRSYQQKGTAISL